MFLLKSNFLSLTSSIDTHCTMGGRLMYVLWCVQDLQTLVCIGYSIVYAVSGRYCFQSGSSTTVIKYGSTAGT